MTRRRPPTPRLLGAARDLALAVATALTRVGRTAAVSVLHD